MGSLENCRVMGYRLNMKLVKIQQKGGSARAVRRSFVAGVKVERGGPRPSEIRLAPFFVP